MGILSKLNLDFLSPSHPIEIFCSEEYHGYHVRGHITHFMDTIYDPTLPDGSADGQYLLAVFVLLRNDLPCSARIIPNNYGKFGVFFGRTLKEFRAIQRNLKRQPPPSVRNRPIHIPIADIDLATTPYLNTAIQNRQEIIPIKIEISLKKVLRRARLTVINPYSYHIHQLLGNHFSSTGENRDEDTVEVFDRLYDVLRHDLNYNHITKDEYFQILTNIGRLSQEGLSADIVTQKFCATFNRLFKKTTKDPSPLNDFFLQFLHDLLSVLNQKRAILRCPQCKNIFPFKINTIYCQTKCRRSPANRRNFMRHADTIRAKSKVRSQKTQGSTPSKPPLKPY